MMWTSPTNWSDFQMFAFALSLVNVDGILSLWSTEYKKHGNVLAVKVVICRGWYNFQANWPVY